MCYHHHNVFLAPLTSNTSLGTQNRETAEIYLKEQWISIKVLSTIKKKTVPKEPLLKAGTKAKSRHKKMKQKKSSPVTRAHKP